MTRITNIPLECPHPLNRVLEVSFGWVPTGARKGYGRARIILVNAIVTPDFSVTEINILPGLNRYYGNAWLTEQVEKAAGMGR